MERWVYSGSPVDQEGCQTRMLVPSPQQESSLQKWMWSLSFYVYVMLPFQKKMLQLQEIKACISMKDLWC